MDLDAFLRSINAYARDYILYLVSFFHFRDNSLAADSIEDEDGRIITHALINLVVGVFIQQSFISNVLSSTKQLAKANLAGDSDKIPWLEFLRNDTFVKLLYSELWIWVLFSIVIYALASMAGRVRYLSALSVTLSVFPPAFAVGAAGCQFASLLYFLFDSPVHPASPLCTSWTGLFFNAAVELILVGVALYYALSRKPAKGDPLIAPRRRWARLLVSGAVVLFLFLAQLAVFGPANVFGVIAYCVARH